MARADRASHDLETRERLLHAAAQLFAERGFERVTVRDICREGRANVAAVNYHFGDKLGLYREVLQTAVHAMRGTLEAAQAAGAGGSPEDRIRAYVRVFLDRVVGPDRDSWIQRLMSRELADPTPALDLIVQQAIVPRMAYLSGLMAQILDCPADDERAALGAFSLHAQCVLVVPNPVAARLYPNFTMTAKAIAGLADHIAMFSIAGIRAMKSAAAPQAKAPRRRRPL